MIRAKKNAKGLDFVAGQLQQKKTASECELHHGITAGRDDN